MNAGLSDDPVLRIYELKDSSCGDYFGRSERLKLGRGIKPILMGDQRIGLTDRRELVGKLGHRFYGRGLNENGGPINFDLTEETLLNTALRYACLLALENGALYYFVTSQREDGLFVHGNLKRVDTFSLTPPSERYTPVAETPFTVKVPRNGF